MSVPSGFLEFLNDMSDRPMDIKPPLPEAQIMTLREIAPFYRNCPFKAGDIVQRRKPCNNKTTGPMIVLEVNASAQPYYYAASDHSVGAATFGARLDIRIMTLLDDVYCAFWMESYELEPYKENAS